MGDDDPLDDVPAEDPPAEDPLADVALAPPDSDSDPLDDVAAPAPPLRDRRPPRPPNNFTPGVRRTFQLGERPREDTGTAGDSTQTETFFRNMAAKAPSKSKFPLDRKLTVKAGKAAKDAAKTISTQTRRDNRIAKGKTRAKDAGFIAGFTARENLQHLVTMPATPATSSASTSSDPATLLTLVSRGDVLAKLAIASAYELAQERAAKRSVERLWTKTQKTTGELLGGSGAEHLVNRYAMGRDVVMCADIVIHRQLKVVDALLNFDLGAVGYECQGPADGAPQISLSGVCLSVERLLAAAAAER